MLKKIALYILLIAFSFRPIYYVSNVLYYQLNIDYIIENYCVNKEKPELQCNGKCHLAKQLAVVNTSTDDDSSKAIINLFESFFPVFSQQSFYKEVNVVQFLTYREIDTFYTQNYKYKFESYLFKPPIS